MRLRNAMLSAMVQQNAVVLISFATGIVIARLLTPAEVGSYSVAMAAAGIAVAVKDFGIASYVISDAKRDEGVLKAALGINLIVAVLLAVAFVALSWPLSTFYRDQALGEVLRIVAFAQLLGPLAFTANIILTRAMRFGALLVTGIVAALCQSVVAILLALGGWGPQALAWGFVAFCAATVCMTVFYEPGGLKVRPTLKGSSRLFAFGSFMSGTMMVGSTAGATPELVIGRIFGLGEAGLFARANNIVSIIRNGLFSAIMRPMLPALGERERQGQSLAPLYLRVVESVTGVAWPAYAVLAVWAEPLVRVLYGPAWEAAGRFIVPIAIAQSLTLAVAPHYDVLIVKRRAGLLFLCEMSAFAFTLAVLWLAVSAGITATVWALVLCCVYFLCLYFYVIQKTIGFKTVALLRTWGRSMVLVALILPPVLLLRHAVPDGPLGTLVGVMASGVAMILMWLVGLRITRHELYGHLVPVVLRLKRLAGSWIVKRAAVGP